MEKPLTMGQIKTAIISAAIEAGDCTRTKKVNLSAIARRAGIEKQIIVDFFKSKKGGCHTADKLLNIYGLIIIKIMKQ